MSRSLFFLLLLVATTLCRTGSIQHSFAATPTRKLYLAMIVNSPSMAQQVVDLTNEARSAAGCPALNVSTQLTEAAQGHSDDMASHNTLSHTGSDGSSPWDRISATGYKFSMAAENIAEGQTTAEAVMEAWMADAGHRQYILDCSLQDIGVGYALSSSNVPYWTQDFATPQ